MSTSKTKASAQAPATPGEALQAAVDNLVAAAQAYAAADGTTTHSFSAGAYRVRFQGEQLLKVERA